MSGIDSLLFADILNIDTNVLAQLSTSAAGGTV
jgi:hypothetical protein